MINQLKRRVSYCICFFVLWSLANVAAFGSETPQLFPNQLKGLRDVYTARLVALGWADFSHSSRDSVVGLLYAPLQKIALSKPLELLLEPRIKIDRKKDPILPSPWKYLIGYAPDGTVWLITLADTYCLVTITRLKNAAETDDPQFSQLYWKDLEEPQFYSQSRFLYDLLRDPLRAKTQRH